MKKIAVIGVTGSIGASTVEVVKNHPDLFKIELATSHNNLQQLLDVSQELNITNIVSTKERQTNESTGKVLYGREEVFRLLKEESYDIVINAVSGSSGLIYSYHILKNNQTLALANKESLVMAGHLLTNMEASIIPIDSEHSALFQIMQGLELKDVKRAILTASGGPFLETPLEKFDEITPQQALCHPTWSMGAKITIDSATMFNKGLEVIEAHWLFGFDYDQIDAVVHPQSIIHSFIECKDGSFLSQMSNPSMQLPIMYALSYPGHVASNLTKTDLLSLPPLEFTPLTKERYPLFYLTVEAGETGGLMPTAINAANEAAIRLFLERKITFPQIYQLIDDYLQDFNNLSNPDLETIIEANRLIYNEIYDAF